jgi:DNA-binding transcriptional LysR family regulator
MDLKQLRSFIAVAKTLNFGRAARHLHLSQSALSIQIQNLEAHLGVPLLERNRRTVRLTAAGESVLADSEQLLQLIADIELRAAMIGSGVVGHLRIGFVASATVQLIPSIVLAFRRLYPGVSLDLKNIPTVQQIDALKSGTIDAGFVRLPLSVEGLSIESIHREPFAIVLPKAHPLATDKRLSVGKLATEPFIAYGRRWAPAFYDHWTTLCRKAGFIPNVVQEAAEMETALVLVAAGLGVAILPQGITQRSRSILKIEPLVGEKVLSEIGVATLTSRTTPLLQRFVKISKEFDLR